MSESEKKCVSFELENIDKLIEHIKRVMDGKEVNGDFNGLTKKEFFEEIIVGLLRYKRRLGVIKKISDSF
jgi:hypothetical protein